MKKSPYKRLPSQAVIKKTFDYCPETGVLSWKARKIRLSRERFDRGFNTQFSGKPTGCPNGNGHLRVLWNGQHYVAHRIIWKWWYGTEAMLVDHMDGDGYNNRIANLRNCTRSQNLANSRTRTTNSKLKGAYPNGGRWMATIRKDGIGTYLGNFATPEEAHEAYCEAAARLHGEFARVK